MNKKTISYTYPKHAICKCHPDFHIPAGVTVGEDFDGREYARKAKESGSDTLVMFGKCHYGFSYYHTKIGTVHPGLQKDMVKEFVEGCKEVSLRSSVYFSLFLDSEAGRQHPEWVLQEKDRTPDDILEDKFILLCVNSGYLEELFMPQLLEALDLYSIDEVFIDTMNNFIPCYCEECHAKFGKQIPKSNEEEHWLEYVRWYYRQYEDFFETIMNRVHEKHPDVKVLINWKWSARLPEKPNQYVKNIAGDLFTSPFHASYFSHYWAGTGIPFDYMCGRFQHGLGDWSSNTPQTLQLTGASSIANGGGFYLIDRQLPSGQMEERSYSAMKDVFDFINARRSFVENTKHVPETAVLYSLNHLVGTDLKYFPELEIRTNRTRQFSGIAKMMIDYAKHYTALNEELLEESLQNYKLLILPEIDFISENLKERIKQFIYDGGSLLIIQNSYYPHIDQDIMSMAGVAYTGRSESGYSYLENTENEQHPILIRGNHAIVKAANGTRVISHFIKPMLINGAEEFGHGYAPATDERTSPAITLRNYGSGKIIYVAAPLFTSYDEAINPSIRKLTMDLYDLLLPQPLVKVNCKAQTELTALRQDNDLILHLVNHSGKIVNANWVHPVIDYVPKQENLEINIFKMPKDCEIACYPEGIIKEVKIEKDYTRIVLSELDLMDSIRVEAYFK